MNANAPEAFHVAPAFFQRSVWEASRGYPSAIRCRPLKEGTPLRGAGTPSSGRGAWGSRWTQGRSAPSTMRPGVKGFSIAPIVVILTAALAIWRFVARGVGDQDGLIIGGAGVVVFMVVQFFMRKAR